MPQRIPAASPYGGAAQLPHSNGYLLGRLPQSKLLARLSLVAALWDSDVTILGGCGHVGLPLGLALADSGCRVTLYDSNAAAVDRVMAGVMPHLELGAQEILERTLASGTLAASVDPSTVGK